MSAARLYVTYPFHPLDSTHDKQQYMQNSVTVFQLFPLFGIFECVLVRQDNCACSLAQTRLNHLSLVLFHTVSVVVHKIYSICTFALSKQMKLSIISCHPIKVVTYFSCLFVSKGNTSLCNFKFSTSLGISLFKSIEVTLYRVTNKLTKKQ